MKTYEIEIQRTSYVMCTVEAEDVDEAKDKAWEWYEKVIDTADADSRITYCEELQPTNHNEEPHYMEEVK